MAVDFKDWKASLPAPAGPFGLTAAEWAETRRLQRIAVVKLADIETLDAWVIVRRSIEALLQQDRDALAAKQAEILSPTSVGDRLLVLKLDAATLIGRIAAREEDLAVPAQWTAQARDGAA